MDISLYRNASPEQLARLSDDDLDSLADEQIISCGQAVEARMHRLLGARRDAALQAMVATPESANEDYTDRLVRLCASHLRSQQ
jgi:hypothetical protein